MMNDRPSKDRDKKSYSTPKQGLFINRKECYLHLLPTDLEREKTPIKSALTFLLKTSVHDDENFKGRIIIFFCKLADAKNVAYMKAYFPPSF